MTHRVAMVAARCRPELGGIESHVAEVAVRLADAGHDIEVLTTDRSGELPRVEDVDGYRVRRYRAYPQSRDWYFSPGLFVALLRRRYDVVHVQGVHTLVAPLAMLACLLRRRPYVLTFHTGGSSSAVRERARGTQWRLLAPLLRRAAVLVGVSRYEAALFDDVLGRPVVRVVRNGGSLPRPHPVPQVEPGLVISSGRLERYKGHHRGIAALPHLLAGRPDARLLILGGGPYRDDLVRLAQAHGVADRVEIRSVPPTDREEMARLVASAGVCVLLSDYEAHPVAVMEALTLGRPVLVSRTSGLTELADDGWASGLDPAASPVETARAIEAQMTSPVSPPLDELPTWESCVTGLQGVYEDTLDGRVRSSRS